MFPAVCCRAFADRLTFKPRWRTSCGNPQAPPTCMQLRGQLSVLVSLCFKVAFFFSSFAFLTWPGLAWPGLAEPGQLNAGEETRARAASSERRRPEGTSSSVGGLSLCNHRAGFFSIGFLCFISLGVMVMKPTHDVTVNVC